ncbi:MAG: DUF4912 domain-containing protein [Deltaproteobacteria bacterium]|nr:DUF4912 domain-containing protein [Deltaproteobacteria bacterium]
MTKAELIAALRQGRRQAAGASKEKKQKKPSKPGAGTKSKAKRKEISKSRSKVSLAASGEKRKEKAGIPKTTSPAVGIKKAGKKGAETRATRKAARKMEKTKKQKKTWKSKKAGVVTPRDLEKRIPGPGAGARVAQPVPGDFTNELPERYKDDQVVLMALDPYSLFCYFDFSDQVFEKVNSSRDSLVLEVASHAEPADNNLSFELEKSPAGSYYVHLASPSTTYTAELTLVGRGRKQTLLHSNRATTPPDKPFNESSSIFRRFRGFTGWFLASPDLKKWTDLVWNFRDFYESSGGGISIPGKKDEKGPLPPVSMRVAEPDDMLEIKRFGLGRYQGSSDMIARRKKTGTKKSRKESGGKR